jgi:hypothetical protein
MANAPSVIARQARVPSCFSLGFAPIGWVLWRASPGLRPAGAMLLVGSVVFLVGRAANTDPLRFAGDVSLLVAAVLVVTGRKPQR